MKKIACLAVFFGLCVLIVAVSAGEMRTWTAGGGKFTTEAEFIETSPDGTMVSLRKKDGKEILVALERFSEEDQEYVMRQKPAKKSEPEPVIKTAPPIKKPSSIVTRQNCIDTILSEIDDIADRETVLKWLQFYKGDEIKYDKVKKFIHCSPKIPPRATSSRYSYLYPAMLVYPNDNSAFGAFFAYTCDNDALFPDRITIADRNGTVWESSRAKWSYDSDIIDVRIWIREDKLYSINEFTEKEADAVMDAIAKNDECVVRISGSKGYRDIEITAAKAKEFKLFYDAYKVLKKYYKYDE